MGVFSLRLLSFVCCLLIITKLTSKANADNNSQNYHYFCDHNNDRGNYTANSTYHENLNTLLSTLTSNTEIDHYGFYNSTYGEKSDKVYAIGLCRGDVKSNECRNCIELSKANLTQLCPNQKEAIGWYEDEKCMLRYSDRSIFGHNEIGPAYFAWSLINATQQNRFNSVVKNLLDSLRRKASLGDSRVKYATQSATSPDNKTIYGLVQCTPDLSATDCDNCLVESIKEVPHCCDSKIGARIVRPSCNLRYETSFLFYGSPAYASPPTVSPSPSPSLSPSSPPSSVTNNTSSEDKGKASGTWVDIIPLLLLLLCSLIFV